jgi:hypothetical protein
MDISRSTSETWLDSDGTGSRQKVRFMVRDWGLGAKIQI